MTYEQFQAYMEEIFRNSPKIAKLQGTRGLVDFLESQTAAGPRSFDFRISPLGQDMLLLPLTPAARNWAWDNLPKGERRLGRNAMVPADRIKSTLTAILLSGLTIAPL